ncbi:MAG: glycosyltransferase [Rikenellaceae bacterium]
MSKNLFLMVRPICKEHICKDVFLVPRYLGEKLNYNVTIVSPRTLRNVDMPAKIDGMSVVTIPQRKIKLDLPKIKSDIIIIKEIFKRAKEIDVMMIFHFRRIAKIGALIYKALNPNGVIYIKLDIDGSGAKQKLERYNHSFMSRLFERLIKIPLKRIDLLSCETQQAHDYLTQGRFADPKSGQKLIVMENGFDEDILSKLDIEERNYDQKEKIFTVVGRLGAKQKNNTMLLRALRGIDLKDWQLYLIGPMEESFRDEVDALINELPHLRDHIVMTGMITDRKELWELYNRSRVFVHTALYESSGLVYYEAKRFRNYIVSTNVGAFEDVTQEGKYGVEVAQDDDAQLAEIMQGIIDERISVDCYGEDFDPQSLSWSRQVEKVAQRIKEIKHL